MTLTEKKATRLSVKDFSNGGSHSDPDLISMEGCDFPDMFTFGNPGILDGVAFGICMRGRVRIKINTKLYNIDESSAMVIMPNHIVEPIERSDDLILKLIFVSLDYVSGLKLNIEAVRLLENTPCIKISAAEKEIFDRMFDLVIQLNNRRADQKNRRAITAILEAISFEMEQVLSNNAPVSDPKTSRAEHLTEQFLKMLIESYKQARYIDYYADRLCVSAKYLSQVVRQTTGETPFEWINKIVMIGAKNLIRTTNKSILQVSDELNFPNPSFFGRFFKKHAGMTPLEFKKQV